MEKNQKAMSKIKIIEHGVFDAVTDYSNDILNRAANTVADRTSNSNSNEMSSSNNNLMSCPLDQVLTQDQSSLTCDVSSQVECTMDGVRQYYCK
jgi:hypothetical protein